MKTRVISGIIGAIVLAGVLLAPPLVLKIAILIVSTLALMELFKVCKVNEFPPFAVLGYVLNFMIIFAFTFYKLLIFPILYIALFSIMLLLMFNLKTVWMKDASKILFLTLYISMCLSSLIVVRRLPQGKFIIWVVFLSAFLSDTCALFVGKSLGRSKLCPKLSPKKTVEGAVGGLLGSVLGVVIFWMFISRFCGVQVNYYFVGLTTPIAAIISQLGDLAASSIKREYGKKDYGSIMPGHGGIMDRIDSVLFVSPFIYFAYLILPIVK